MSFLSTMAGAHVSRPREYFWPNTILPFQLVTAIVMVVTIVASFVYRPGFQPMFVDYATISFFCVAGSLMTVTYTGLYVLVFSSGGMPYYLGVIIIFFAGGVGLMATFCSTYFNFQTIPAAWVVCQLVASLACLIVSAFIASVFTAGPADDPVDARYFQAPFKKAFPLLFGKMFLGLIAYVVILFIGRYIRLLVN